MTATGFPAPTFSETGALPTGVTLNATAGVLVRHPGGRHRRAPTRSPSPRPTASLPDATQSFTLTVATVPGAPTIVERDPR